jgi:hypothetical protein
VEVNGGNYAAGKRALAGAPHAARGDQGQGENAANEIPKCSYHRHM